MDAFRLSTPAFLARIVVVGSYKHSGSTPAVCRDCGTSLRFFRHRLTPAVENTVYSTAMQTMESPLKPIAAVDCCCSYFIRVPGVSLLWHCRLLQGVLSPWDSHTLGNCTSPLMEGFGLPVVEAVQLPCTPVLWCFLVVFWLVLEGLIDLLLTCCCRGSC